MIDMYFFDDAGALCDIERSLEAQTDDLVVKTMSGLSDNDRAQPTASKAPFCFDISPSQSCSFLYVSKKNHARKKNEASTSGPVRRTITNETYLRKLYLPFRKAKRLLSSLECTPMQCKTRRNSKKLVQRIIINILNNDRRWLVAFECALSFNRQIHCRFVEGWSSFCKDNGLCINDAVVFWPSATNDHEIRVQIEKSGTVTEEKH